MELNNNSGFIDFTGPNRGKQTLKILGKFLGALSIYLFQKWGLIVESIQIS